MRKIAWGILGLFLVCSLSAMGCGDDDGSSGGTGGTGGSGGTGGTGGSGGGGSSGIVSDLNVTPILSGLARPWDIGWLPDGTILVTERPGRLNVYVDGIDQAPSVVTPPDIELGSEGGMLGLEVDPRFSENGYVYVCFTSDLGGPSDVRLVRYTLDPSLADPVVARDDIVTGMPYSSGRHSGCRPRFGPDGYLWVGTGDAALGETPQDDNSLGGKVLRIDREGAAHPDNPRGLRWYSKGHRNIQGIAFRSSDDLGVSAEHGPSVDDEINLLVAGGNFGWDPVPGYNESVPMTDLEKFPDAVEAIFSTGSPTLAYSGATFIEGNWGNWNGALAVATLKAQHLHLYSVDATGNVTDEGRYIEDQGRLRSPRMGPDGALYITTDGSGDSGLVLRVTPVLIMP